MTSMAKDTFWSAQSYSTNSDYQYHVGSELFKKYPYQGNEKILDVGCGPGRITVELAQLVPAGQVTGIDYSADMVKFASQNNLAPNIEYKQMDAAEINLPGQKFDVIVSSFCLHWVINKLNAFHAMAKHFNKDADLMVIASLPKQETARVRQKLFNSKKWCDYYKSYTDPNVMILDHEYGEYAKKAGFLNINYRTENFVIQFKNIEKMKGFLKNITPCLAQLPTDELRDEFMDEYVESYLQEFPAPVDGHFELPYRYVVLTAKGVDDNRQSVS